MYVDGHPVYSCLFVFDSAAASYTLTRGPSPLKPSDSAPVLQYCSGLSSNFLTKILDIDTPLFLFNTQFYFSLSLLFISLIKVWALML
jgi:hypothetical protein